MRLPEFVTRRLIRLLHPRTWAKKPDVIIEHSVGPSAAIDRPYLERWFVIPKNRFMNIYLHRFNKSDDARALHDHPWANITLVLKGRYREYRKDGSSRVRIRGAFAFRCAATAHRIELLDRELLQIGGLPYQRFAPVVTLFITGPKVREWGFHCPQGWRHWKDFTAEGEGTSRVGRGCDD